MSWQCLVGMAFRCLVHLAFIGFAVGLSVAHSPLRLGDWWGVCALAAFALANVGLIYIAIQNYILTQKKKPRR